MCSFRSGKKWTGFELAGFGLFFFHHCPALILVWCPSDPICNAGGGGGEETTAPGDSVAARSSNDGHPPRCLLTSKLSSMLSNFTVVHPVALLGGGDIEAREQRLPRGVGLGIELGERVAVGREPHGLECGAGAARADAQLLVPGGECWGGIIRVERGEGAGEVTERGPLGRWRERWHDLADVEWRCDRLDLEEVGDGVGELSHGGAELERQRERLEPRGYRLPLRGRHGGR
jgi:hypothetical protein